MQGLGTGLGLGILDRESVEESTRSIGYFGLDWDAKVDWNGNIASIIGTTTWAASPMNKMVNNDQQHHAQLSGSIDLLNDINLQLNEDIYNVTTSS